MCGIFALLTSNIGINHSNTTKLADKIKHRGPDSSSYNCITENVFFAFHRLCIVGDEHGNKCGMQPFMRDNSTMIANCEIYNNRDLILKYDLKNKMVSNCDAEVIVHLYNKVRDDEITMEEMYRSLDGVFAFIIYDGINNQIVIGRDPIGVRSLYVGIANSEYSEFAGSNIIITSEMKAIPIISDKLKVEKGIISFNDYMIIPFEPGTVSVLSQSKKSTSEPSVMGKEWQRQTNYNFKNTYTDSLPLDVNHTTANDIKNIISTIRRKLEIAVGKRLMCDRLDEIGCLLSGGLDSSIIVALLVKKLKSLGVEQKLKTFSVGMPGSTDLKYARIVADHLGTDHHEVLLTSDYLFSLVDKCIYHIESYDITTVRASVPMMALSMYIAENTNVKVIFSGEGSDEASGSYLYFHNAPSPEAFREETIRLMDELHYFDVLRCDKSTAAAGLEVRVPFLDKDFLEFYMAIPSSLKVPTSSLGAEKKRIEKYLLRKAFEDMLPYEITWRTKEALSDGISSMERPWFEILQERIASATLKQHSFGETKERIGVSEKEYYKQIFDKYYPGCEDVIPHYWMPKWSGDVTNPSARILNLC